MIELIPPSKYLTRRVVLSAAAAQVAARAPPQNKIYAVHARAGRPTEVDQQKRNAAQGEQRYYYGRSERAYFSRIRHWFRRLQLDARPRSSPQQQNSSRTATYQNKR